MSRSIAAEAGSTKSLLETIHSTTWSNSVCSMSLITTELLITPELASEWLEDACTGMPRNFQIMAGTGFPLVMQCRRIEDPSVTGSDLVVNVTPRSFSITGDLGGTITLSLTQELCVGVLEKSILQRYFPESSRRTGLSWRLENHWTRSPPPFPGDSW